MKRKPVRVILLLASCCVALAQAVDPAYEPLTKAYEALRAKRYDEAVGAFRRAIELDPNRVAARKDLAYTYLKIGETESARDEFGEAMRLDPADNHLAMEYAFLCYETKEQAQARRIFDRVRKTGDPVAQQAFENIDRPLREGIERWKKAIELGSDTFSAHYELATLAEQRDELNLAAEHFLRAWRLIPDRRSVLVDLGRVSQRLKRDEEAVTALLAASRGGEPRAADAARKLLPARYPYVYEFRRALELDPANTELRRELAYLLLRMDRSAEAEREFQIVCEKAPDDLLSAAQLGFLYLARGDKERAIPLLDRVMKGPDEDLANRVRAVLRLPQKLKPRSDNAAPVSVDAKLMAERSFKAGYIRDALKYLQIAHEADPIDFSVMLKMGWAYNLLHDDAHAVPWFDLARRSPDPQISGEALRAYRNLRSATQRFQTTIWVFPTYSSRWRDLFAYGQIKTEWKPKFPLRPYVSIRLIGDSRRELGQAQGVQAPPQYLSESAVIFGVGLRTPTWKGLMGWAEAGSAAGYLTHHVLPDYRGGISFARGWGRLLGAEDSGWFFETNDDGVFISRFDKDFLVYSQNRGGYTAVIGGLRFQLYWNANVTFDQKRQAWANYTESGPGSRFRWSWLPESMSFTVNYLRGSYSVPQDGSRPSTYTDFRSGVWYAFSR